MEFKGGHPAFEHVLIVSLGRFDLAQVFAHYACAAVSQLLSESLRIYNAKMNACYPPKLLVASICALRGT
jgi:hypothetical protein